MLTASLTRNKTSWGVGTSDEDPSWVAKNVKFRYFGRKNVKVTEKPQFKVSKHGNIITSLVIYSK